MGVVASAPSRPSSGPDGHSRGPAGPPTVEARATDGASRPQDALCAVAVSAVRGGGPEFCDPGRRAARGGAGTEARPRNLGCRPASPGSSRSLATAQRKSGKLTFRKRGNSASRASAGGQHATRSDAREFSLASKDLPQTGLERIEFALRPPRNSRAFVDPERDKQHPKRDHYDPESRYQQDDWQQGCRD